MKVDLNGITVTAPEGFLDATGYFFQDDQQHEMLMLDYGSVPKGARNVDDVMADRRHELEFKRQTPITVLRLRSGTLQGHPASRLHFTVKDDPDFDGWLVVVLLDPEEYFQISYGGHDGKRSGDKFRQVLGSLRFAESPAGPPTAGVRPYHAGRVSLNIPTSLRTPHTCTFVSRDRQTEIEVTLTGVGQGATSVDAAVAADAVIGKVDDSRSGHTAINGRLGTMVDYVFTRHEPGSPVQAVRRAGVVFGDGSTLSVYGRAPVASGAQMQATVQGILEGIGGAN